MHTVYVNRAYRKGTQQPTKAMRVWAKFALSTDAERFAETTKAANPNWRVEVKIDYRNRYTNGRLIRL